MMFNELLALRSRVAAFGFRVYGLGFAKLNFGPCIFRLFLHGLGFDVWV